MKHLTKSILIFSILFLSCCQLKNERLNEISKISFATGGCFGECPFLAIEIDSSLNYKFYGGKYCEKQGFFTGRVSKSFWDSLNIKFESINYKVLDSSYQNSVDDLSIQLIISYSGKTKSISAQFSSLPDSTYPVVNWLMNSYKMTSLTKTTDSIEFKTTLQFPLRHPILPDKYKFVPPDKKVTNGTN